MNSIQIRLDTIRFIGKPAHDHKDDDVNEYAESLVWRKGVFTKTNRELNEVTELTLK